jgi:hypothetical protein
MTALQQFVGMSEELSGIPSFYLSGTGYAQLYFQTAVNAAGGGRIDRLLHLYQLLPTCCRRHRDAALRSNLLADNEVGPVAQNIIKLWYTATWLEMPQEWHAQFLPGADNCSFVPAPYAYAESLLGPAVGAHPAGAKPTGYQSWTSPPTYLPLAPDDLPDDCSSASAG